MSESELKAETEIEAAIRAAIAAPADDEIEGLGPSDAPLYRKLNPTPKSQYNTTLEKAEKPILLTYFSIRGMGEVPRLILAEANMPYETLVMVGGEDQSVAMEWRSHSPNGLLPLLSGAGIPRSCPISQSSTIIRFLAKRLGMDGNGDGGDAMAALRVDNLYETSKDLGGSDNIATIASVDPNKDYNAFKGPFATGRSIEKMLVEMPDPKDPESILNYGQLHLFYTLLRCEARRGGCVKENLGDVLDAFRVHMENRAGLKEYLASSGCFPFTMGELGQSGGYAYSTGPRKRGDITTYGN